MWPFGRKKRPPAFNDFKQDAAAVEEWHRRDERERPVIMRHLALGEKVGIAYARRASGLGPAIRACDDQIAFAPQAMAAFHRQHQAMNDYRRIDRKGKPLPFRPVSHPGFKQLAIIREKEGNYAEAIRLAREAKKQGWTGDWEKRIARCEAKVATARK